MKIVIIVTGSISAFKACSLVSKLTKDGHEVRVVMTEGAKKLIGEASFEALSNNPVISDLWAPRENMLHIRLRDWADQYLVYPASANRIAEFAHGLAPDLIGALYLANNFKKPFWVAPAMNTEMLAHPQTQANLKTIENHGARLIMGEAGYLACGDVGAGRLVEPDIIYDLLMNQKSKSPYRILVTGGAMTEKIDAVRSITNTSSGRTASAIVFEALSRGFQVDYLHHETAQLDGVKLANTQSYLSYVDFSEKIFALLAVNKYDAIIHSAAVSDYSVKPFSGKLDSGKNESLELTPNPKILPLLREKVLSNTKIFGFKLTLGENEIQAKARALDTMQNAQVDGIVWNDFKGGMSSTEISHNAVFFTKDNLHYAKNNKEIASLLCNAIESRLL